ncbi:RHS repeat protein, partial [Macrococcus equipercicus]
NSKTNHTGMFGLGWMSGFERRLNIEDTAVTPKVVQYTEEDGSIHLFINQDGKLLAPTGVDYEFNILNGEYIIKDEDGSQEVYGKDGLLNRIEYDAKQTGKKNAVRFIYEDTDGIKQLKTILSASDPGNTTVSKNRIEFEYNDQNLVTKMTVSGSSDSNAASRIYTYQYDSFKRLTSVTGPDGTYTYSYREKYALNADGTEVSPEDVRYPGEIEIYGMPGNIDGSHQISAVYEEDVLKSVKDDEGITTHYALIKEDNGASAEVSGEERVTEKSTFDKQGHLLENRTESNPAKITTFQWLDHRITKTTHPDGEVEISDYGRRESANKTDQELDGNVVKEKDATSQTTYEYAANQDDVIATTDEFNIKDEVALNADREEVADYSVQDAVIGFTQYNQFGNESRTGVSLAAGSNLLKGGSFENTNTFSGGTVVDGGINGKALKLSGQNVTQDIPFKAGQPLNISGSFKLSTSSKGAITLKFLNSSSAVISSVVIPSPKAEGRWIRKMEEEVAPTGTVKASVELSATAGTVMFDEIQIETAQAGHSTSVTPFNFVEQGGFNGTDKWSLTSGAASASGFEGSEALQLSAGGSATQKVNIAQATAKPIYVTALSKNANASDTLKATVTYSDGTQATLEQPFQTLDQNNDLWQRQTVQFSAENKPAIKTVDVTLTNKDGETLFDAVRVSEGRAVEETTYDQQNNFVTQESGLSKSSVVYENDAFGNVLSVTQGSKKRSNVYDNKDNLLKTTAENGAVISYDYNQKNQVSAKHFEGQDTSYTYNKNRISSVKTADGKVTQYAYNDKTGDLSRIDLPSGKSIVYKYNSEGDTTAVSDGTKNLFDYVYDADGNLTEIKDSTNSKSKRYSYENTLTSSAGDGQGRLLSITDYFGINQSYKYVTGIDSIKTDLPSSMTFNGVESIYGYDKVNRLDKVEVSGNKWLFRHDELGRVNQTKLPMNTGSVEYEFGDNGAIESLVSETGTANVVNDQYSYDQYGNMSQKQSNGVVSTYQYDAMDQLTEEKIGDKTFSYTYDKRGNRTSINGVNATFNIMNQLTQFGSESISYDADGNRTGDGKFTYEWDGLGQMTKLTEKSTGETWTYQYDEQGRRIAKVHNGTTTRYHYDSDTNHLMAESQDGQVIRQYIRDQDGELLGLKVNDKYYSYHKNYRGDIISITDMSGNLQASYEYDSWGNVLKEDVKDTNLKGQPFRYASYFYDNESSQYYLMARYYHPKHGLFLSVDPDLGADERVGMHNGYAYADNNPIIKIDSNGKNPILRIIIIASSWIARGVVVVTKAVFKKGKKVTVRSTKYIDKTYRSYSNAKKYWGKTKRHSTKVSKKGDTALPFKGTPNSSKDLISNGKLKQRRYYDKNGKPEMDVDFFHSASPKQNIKFPHTHTFPNGKRTKH